MKPDVKLMRLEEVAQIYAGVSPKPQKGAFGEDGCPWVMGEDLSGTTVGRTARRLTAQSMRTVKVAPAGTVFFSSAGTIGKVGIAGEPMAPSNNIIAVEFDTAKVLPLYGMYCLSALRADFEAASQSSVYQSLRLSRFRKFQIPVPDMDWQKMVAGKLEALHSMVTQQQLAIEDAVRAARQSFEELFQEPIARVVSGDLAIPLEKCADIRLNGALKKNTDGAVPVRYVSTPQLEDWEIRWEQVPTAAVEPLSLAHDRLQPGDIVMNRINQADRLGRCALAASFPEEAVVFGQNTLAIRARAGSYHPAFLFAWLTHPYIKQYIQRHGKHSTSFQSSLSGRVLTELPVPSVPLAAQEAFARRFADHLQYVRNGHQILETLQGLRQVWLDQIRVLLREAGTPEGPAPYQERQYWIAPSGAVYFYDASLECIQVSDIECRQVRLSQLPVGVDLQFVGALRGMSDPAYGALAHLRLRRTDRDAWTLVQMVPQMYRPQDKAGAEQLEREGLLSERQDFGYLRRERVLSLDGAALVADALALGTAVPGYSRFQQLPTAVRTFLEKLSPFQQSVYEEFLLAMQPLPCNMVLDQMILRGSGQAEGLTYRLQDVISAVHLMEHAGLLERAHGRSLYYYQRDPGAGPPQPMLDHRGQPIPTDIWSWTAPRG